MRIVYLHQYFTTPAQPGGTRSYEMARRWAAAGHEVHVVTSDYRPKSRTRSHWRTESLDGFTVHRYPVAYGNQMGFARRIVAFFAFALLAGPRARNLRGDAVFASSTPLTIAIPAIWATLLRRTPLVFEVRDLWPDVPIALGALRNPVSRSLARYLERLAYKRATRIIALSPGMKAGIVAHNVDEKKIVIAPNASDFATFAVPESAGEAYRAKNDWLGDRPFVTYCGTFGRVNGVSYLVQLAAELARGGSDVVFGLYGDGAERQAAEDLAKSLGIHGSAVVFAGSLPKAEMPAVFSASDLCTSVCIAVPALEANSANKFFDALAASRPIAVNYGGWQAELIQEHAIGITLHPTDIGQAAETVRQFLGLASEERRSMGRAAAALAHDRFDRDTVSLRVLATILEAYQAIH